MKNYIIIVLSLIYFWLATSCSRSAVYSPSLNLPNKTLQKKEIDLQGGFELLPESRPHNLQGNKTTLGLNGSITYGFSNKFNLAMKSWIDIDGRSNFVRSGYALTGQYIIPRSELASLIVIPRIGIAAQDTDISGYGIATSIIYHKIVSTSFSTYGGLGFAWGFEDLSKRENVFDKEKLPMGFGLISNFGLSWEFSKHMRINIELNPIYQINTFDEQNDFIISPQLGIGYTIR